MCTVTWLHTGDGYHLFSNRDEKRTRAEALPPVERVRRGVRILAPRDADHGGTWISVNETGLTLCLLNDANLGSSRPKTITGCISRGLLVDALAGSISRRDVLDGFARIDLHLYAPFTLVVLERQRPALLLEWNSESLSILSKGDRLVPLASSSLNGECARRIRTGVFQRTRPSTPGDLARFHSSHAPEPGPYSPCMHRDDASTVSFTHVSVGASGISMTYQPGAPCGGGPPVHTQLHASSHSDCLLHAGQ